MELLWYGCLKYLIVLFYDDIKFICFWCFDDKIYKLVINLRSYVKCYLSINLSKNVIFKY